MELIDILDQFGNKTGQIKDKDKAHLDGDWHAVSKIWLLNKRGELLIQQRSANKKVKPLKWTFFTGGHISAGENPDDAAIRELKEEIGLDIDRAKLKLIKTINMDYQIANGREREVTFEYLVVEDLDVDKIKKKLNDEVETVICKPLPEIEEIIAKNDPDYVIDREAEIMIEELKSAI